MNEQKRGKDHPDFIDRVGEIHSTKNYGKVEIIEYFNNRDCTIKFIEDGTVVYKKEYKRVKEGEVRNPNKPSVCGVGYVGIGEYKPRDHKIAYKKWASMFDRSYSYNNHVYSPSYKDCSVDSRWHCFQNFAKWWYSKWKSYMDKTWTLDKDLLIRWNKVYSPETCCLLPVKINNTLTGMLKKDRKYPLGVHYDTGSSKFIAQIRDKGRPNMLASKNTPEEAFYVYKPLKEQQLKDLAEIWKEFIEEDAYQALINYEILITD